MAEDLEHAIEYYEKSADLDVEVGIGCGQISVQLEDDLSAGQKLVKCALVSFRFSIY